VLLPTAAAVVVVAVLMLYDAEVVERRQTQKQGER
jgi:hypothetical protein